MVRRTALLTLGFLVLAVMPSGAQNLLVTNADGSSVSKLNSFARAVTGTASVAVDSTPLVVAINPANTLAAVFSFTAGPPRVDFFDITGNTPVLSGSSVSLTGTFLMGVTGLDIAFSSDGACVVVAHGPGTGQTSSIDVANRLERNVLGGTGPRAVETVPSHPTLVLGAGIIVVTVRTLSANCTLSGATNLTIGVNNENIRAFPNGQGALVADSGGGGAVHVLSIAANGTVSFVKTIVIGGGPQSIAITPESGHAFVYKSGTGKLRVLAIDPSNTVTDTGFEITVPASPFGFSGFDFVATDGNTVFVSGTTSGGNTVTMVDVPTSTVVGTVVTGTTPAGIAFGGCPHHTVHGHLSTAVPSHLGNYDVHHGQHGHLVTAAATCPPHAPGHTPGLAPDPSEGLFDANAFLSLPAPGAGIDQDGTSNGDPAALQNPGAPVLPAKRGTVQQLFVPADGLFLDPADERPAAGFTAPASGTPLYFTTGLPEVRIGGALARVLFSGLAPGQTGVWQINVLIPEGAPSGRVPVTISYEGDELPKLSVVIE